MSRRRRDRRKFFAALGPMAPRAVVELPKVESAVRPRAVVRPLEVVHLPALDVVPTLDLQGLTVAQLRALAIERGVVLGMQRRTKAAIIEALA